MLDAHYHCSICDGGDYDLCEGCIASGKLCPGDGHWLVKRFIQNGRVISSTTERLPPKPKAQPNVKLVPTVETPSAVSTTTAVSTVQPSLEKIVPGAFSTDIKSEPLVATRTCNSCIEGISRQSKISLTFLLTRFPRT